MMTKPIEEVFNLALLDEELKPIVLILLRHQDNLTDGYGYYIPTCDDDSDLYGRFHGDGVLWFLEKIAREIKDALS